MLRFLSWKMQRNSSAWFWTCLNLIDVVTRWRNRRNWETYPHQEDGHPVGEFLVVISRQHQWHLTPQASKGLVTRAGMTTQVLQLLWPQLSQAIIPLQLQRLVPPLSAGDHIPQHQLSLPKDGEIPSLSPKLCIHPDSLLGNAVVLLQVVTSCQQPVFGSSQEYDQIDLHCCSCGL